MRATSRMRTPLGSLPRSLLSFLTINFTGVTVATNLSVGYVSLGLQPSPIIIAIA